MKLNKLGNMIIEFPKSWKFHCEIEKITINLEASISTWKRQFGIGNFTTDLETRYFVWKQNTAS